MRINHNIAALNTYRQFNNANNAQSKAMEKLSSGLRINKAGDDAAGLAISEKMRGQIRGLDMATKNAQDGVSMLQTAEGALNETHDILQRMRELANQAANDTNTDSDRGEIQKEVNQLSSEINRIGNTTEFNTKSLLKGDGKANLTSSGLVPSDVSQTGANVQHTQASATVTFSNAAAVNNDALSIDLNGITLTATFTTNDNTKADSEALNVTGSSADINIAASANASTSGDGFANALNAMIEKNDILKGNYKAVSDGAGVVTISAVAGGKFEGAAGTISNYDESGVTTAANFTEGLTNAVGSTTAPTTATTNLDFSAAGLDITTKAKAEALVGKGFTINDQQVEFYNANNGEYTGNAVGINISDAINATSDWDDALANTISTQLDKLDGIKAAATTTTSGIIQIDTEGTGTAAKLEIKDGGIQSAFKAKYQVGANENQSMTIDINDMRSQALGLTGKAGQGNFTVTNSVTNGTDDNTVEAALDVSTHEKAASAITSINKAIETVSAERSKLGAFSNRLDHTINNLGTSSENLTAAESRIRDVDYALAA